MITPATAPLADRNISRSVGLPGSLPPYYQRTPRSSRRPLRAGLGRPAPPIASAQGSRRPRTVDPFWPRPSDAGLGPIAIFQRLEPRRDDRRCHDRHRLLSFRFHHQRGGGYRASQSHQGQVVGCYSALMAQAGLRLLPECLVYVVGDLVVALGSTMLVSSCVEMETCPCSRMVSASLMALSAPRLRVCTISTPPGDLIDPSRIAVSLITSSSCSKSSISSLVWDAGTIISIVTCMFAPRGLLVAKYIP